MCSKEEGRRGGERKKERERLEKDRKEVVIKWKINV
jgi:hypothetical protein